MTRTKKEKSTIDYNYIQVNISSNRNTNRNSKMDGVDLMVNKKVNRREVKKMQNI